MFLLCKRNLTTTRVLWKQTEDAQRRLLRKLKPTTHRVPTVWQMPEAKDATYPPVKPKYPEGVWGSMEPKAAWKMHELATKLSEIPTIFERMQHLSLVEQNMWYHSIKLPFHDPNPLQFFQYITGSKLLEDWPTVLQPEGIQKDPHWQQTELSAIANRVLVNSPWSSGKSSSQTLAQMQHANIVNLMENVIIHQMHGSNCPEHLRNAHIDEESRVESFIKRYGYAELGMAVEDRPRRGFSFLNHTPGLLLSEVDRTVRDEDGMVKYTLRAPLAWSMRTSLPLKPFVDKNDDLCYNGRLPIYNYHPEFFELKPEDCRTFECIPLHKTFYGSTLARNIAGYWCESPFSPSDPRPHSLLGVVDINPVVDALRNLEKKGGFTFSNDLLVQQIVSEGLLTGFTWCVSQALNAGCHPYGELQHPISCQLLLTNGIDQFHLIAYQLNSISRLWKPLDVRLPFNLAWHRHVNVESVSDFLAQGYLQKMLFAPVDASFQHEADKLRTKEEQWRDFIQPDPLMEAENRHRWGRPPPRIFNLPRPHPNRMFYFQLVEKSDLLKELRSTVTKTKFAEMPEPYETQGRQHRLHRKLQKRGREKTLKPPPIWK